MDKTPQTPSRPNNTKILKKTTLKTKKIVVYIIVILKITLLCMSNRLCGLVATAQLKAKAALCEELHSFS